MAIKISGILKDGMGRPIPKCTIELLCKKTSLTVVVETEARIGLDNTGSYNMQVEPGKYDVSLYIVGFPPKRAGEIQVYLDSRPGTLNDFLTMPGESDLTPELVLIFQQLRDEARQAANEAKADKELADSILTDVITAQTDVNEKQQQVNADMVEAGKSKTASAASAKAAFDDAGKTAADVATVAGLKANAETAAQQAELSNVSAKGHAGRAELAANSVKTLTASANTLAPGTNATALWNPVTNNLLVGIPSGLKGDKGDKGDQGIQGIQGQQGIQGIKGDKGDTGPQAQLSPLLAAISALNTAANQLIYLTGKDTAAVTALTDLGRRIIAATKPEYARAEIGAAADSEVLKIGNNLSEISTPIAKVAARDNLGLGSAAILNAGTKTGNVITVGVSQLRYSAQSTGVAGWVDISMIGYTSDVDVWRDSYISLLKQKCNLSGQWSLVSSLGFHTDPGASPNLSGIAMACTDGNIYTRTWVFRNDGHIISSIGGFFWNQVNTAVDANGFIKRASPVVKLFSDGSCELNNESKGVTAERLSEGVYRLSGSLMGFNSDGLWDIEVPSDDNKQPLIWVKSTVEANGDIIVKTYHRTHPNAPIFAQNTIEGYNDGDPIDIPSGRWIDLRVQVYADELEVVALDS